MKLLIQIPCFNEAGTLASVIADLPSTIPGIDVIETLVIDDGSTDGTSDIAVSLGVDHIVRHPQNLGLAAAFTTGLRACLDHGADIIVNTDGDHQYPSASIAALVKPIVDGQADLVVGDRKPQSDARVPKVKRFLYCVGSLIVSVSAGQRLLDPVSGFRAYGKVAATRTTVTSKFSYTIETLMRASCSHFRIHFVTITANESTRPSRLFRSTPEFLWRSALIVLSVLFRCLAVKSLNAFVQARRSGARFIANFSRYATWLLVSLFGIAGCGNRNEGAHSALSSKLDPSASDFESLYSHDFGVISPGTSHSHTFEVTNTWGQELAFVAFRRSCDCTDAKISNQHLLPGEKTQVQLGLTAAKISTDTVVRVAVCFQGNEKIELPLVLHTHVREPLAVTASLLRWDYISGDSPQPTEFLVENFSDSQWKSIVVTPSEAWLRVVPVPIRSLDGALQAWACRVQLDTNALNAGEHRGTISVKSCDPDVCRSVELPVQVRIKPIISVVPSQVFLARNRHGQDEDTETIELSIRVSSRLDTLVASDFHSSSTLEFIKTEVVPFGSGQWKLRCEFKKVANCPRGEIVLRVKKLNAIVSIPVIISSGVP